MTVKQQKLEEIEKLKQILKNIESAVEFSRRNNDGFLNTKLYNMRRCKSALNYARDELNAILHAERRFYGTE